MSLNFHEPSVLHFSLDLQASERIHLFNQILPRERVCVFSQMGHISSNKLLLVRFIIFYLALLHLWMHLCLIQLICMTCARDRLESYEHDDFSPLKWGNTQGISSTHPKIQSQVTKNCALIKFFILQTMEINLNKSNSMSSFKPE